MGQPGCGSPTFIVAHSVVCDRDETMVKKMARQPCKDGI